MNLELLKYPIGKFVAPTVISHSELNAYINELEIFPKNLFKEVAYLNDEQLNTTYRPNGWTIRQVVHHCADSHMNSFIRLKWALTEENPTIKPYYEERWAELNDSKILPITPSLKMLDALHERYVSVLKSLDEQSFQKTFVHPEHGKIFTIKDHIALYAWHGKHHLAQITELKRRENWA